MNGKPTEIQELLLKKRLATFIVILNMQKAKPIFERRLFWDVDFDNIDYDAKARFVIERVFERGDVQDIRNCRRYYGDEKIAEILLSAKFLPELRLYLAAAVIDKPIEDFKCYTLKQLNPKLFPY